MSAQPVDATVDTRRRALLAELAAEQCAAPPTRYHTPVRSLVEHMDRPLSWDEWRQQRAGYAALGPDGA
jgi:hypothetical protein